MVLKFPLFLTSSAYITSNSFFFLLWLSLYTLVFDQCCSEWLKTILIGPWGGRELAPKCHSVQCFFHWKSFAYPLTPKRVNWTDHLLMIELIYTLMWAPYYRSVTVYGQHWFMDHWFISLSLSRSLSPFPLVILLALKALIFIYSLKLSNI